MKLSDRAAIEAALSAASFEPAEHAFANLWLFRDRHAYRWHDEPVPHIRGVTYDGVKHALPLTPLVPDLIDMLSGPEVECLFPLGADALALAEPHGLEISFQAADSDYWFAAEALATLSGAKLRRQQARAFARDYAPVAHPIDEVSTSALLDVLAGWERDVGRPVHQTDAAECREAIVQASALGLSGLLVRTGDGLAVAFLLANRAGDAATVHFAKGLRSFSNAYPWMFATFAARCGAGWINFEQDLGNPGFAQSKRAYGPALQQAKYRLGPIKP